MPARLTRAERAEVRSALYPTALAPKVAESIDTHLSKLKQLNFGGQKKDLSTTRRQLTDYFLHRQHEPGLGAAKDLPWWDRFQQYRIDRGLPTSDSYLRRMRSQVEKMEQFQRFNQHTPQNPFKMMTSKRSAELGGMSGPHIERRFQELLADEQRLIAKRASAALTAEENAQLAKLPGLIQQTERELVVRVPWIDVPKTADAAANQAHYFRRQTARGVTPGKVVPAEQARTVSDAVHWKGGADGFEGYLRRSTNNEVAALIAARTRKFLLGLADRVMGSSATFRTLAPADLTPAHVNALLLNLRTGRWTGGQGVSGRTLHTTTRNDVTHFVDYLITRGALPPNASLHGKLYRFSSERVRVPKPLTAEEVQRYLATTEATAEDTAEALITKAYARLAGPVEGRRSIEPSWLKAEDLDVAKRRLRVTHAKSGSGGKVRKQTWEEIGNDTTTLLDRIRTLLDLEPGEPLLPAFSSLDDAAQGFGPYRAMATEDVRALMEGVMVQSRVAAPTQLHNLRRASATGAMAQEGLPIAQQILGQARSATTMNYVRNQTPDAMHAFTNKVLDRAWFRVGKDLPTSPAKVARQFEGKAPWYGEYPLFDENLVQADLQGRISMETLEEGVQKTFWNILKRRAGAELNRTGRTTATASRADLLDYMGAAVRRIKGGTTEWTPAELLEMQQALLRATSRASVSAAKRAVKNK